jgi:hypothetical protein
VNPFQSGAAFFGLLPAHLILAANPRFASPGGCDYLLSKVVVEMNKFQQPQSNLPGEGWRFPPIGF